MLLVAKLLHTLFKPSKNEANELLETGKWPASASGVTTEGLRVMLGAHLEIFLTEYSKGHQSQSSYVSGLVLVCMTPIRSKPSDWPLTLRLSVSVIIFACLAQWHCGCR